MTDKTASVSLVISVWNRKDDLRENLAAIREQTVKPLEVIVVDNNSSDGTPEMVIEEFPEVHLIRMPHSDYGACETFNVGFSSARGEYTGILDDDVILPKDFVARMMEEFEAEPDTTVLLSPKDREALKDFKKRMLDGGRLRCELTSIRKTIGSDV